MARRQQPRSRNWRAVVAGVVACWSAVAAAAAASAHHVHPGEPLPTLAPGDLVTLAAGHHQGPWLVSVADVTLSAEPGAVLDGGGSGSALTLSAPGIRVEGLWVRNVGSNADLYTPDAAFALDGCDGCSLQRVGAGAPGDGVSAALRIEASADVVVDTLRAYGSGFGPGVTSYQAAGLDLATLELTGFLDGLYLERSDDLQVRDATINDSKRYGVHLMFNRGSRLHHVRVVGGAVGSAIMYGRDTLVSDFVAAQHVGPMAFGLLVQEERESRVERATLSGNTIGLLAVAATGLQVDDSDFVGNGFGVLLQRLPAAFDELDAGDDTSLVISASRFLRNAFDVALDDERADVRVHGNAYDRAAALDLDGDGWLDLSHVVGTSLAALAARVPDVSLLAFGPALVLWEGLEARVPGVRFSMLADPAPRRYDPTTSAQSPERRRSTFVLLAALPLLGSARALWWPGVAANRRHGARP